MNRRQKKKLIKNFADGRTLTWRQEKWIRRQPVDRVVERIEMADENTMVITMTWLKL